MGKTAGRLEGVMDHREFREHMVDCSLPPLYAGKAEQLLALLTARVCNMFADNGVTPFDLLFGASEQDEDEIADKIKRAFGTH